MGKGQGPGRLTVLPETFAGVEDVLARLGTVEEALYRLGDGEIGELPPGLLLLSWTDPEWWDLRAFVAVGHRSGDDLIVDAPVGIVTRNQAALLVRQLAVPRVEVPFQPAAAGQRIHLPPPKEPSSEPDPEQP